MIDVATNHMLSDAELIFRLNHRTNKQEFGRKVF